MAERARFQMQPLAFAVPAADLARWARSAPAGSVTIYAFGLAPPRGEAAWTLARSLFDEGAVDLYSERRAEGGHNWCARRRESAAAAAPVVDAPAPLHPRDEKVLALITSAALAGRVCPTNRELADACGLKTAVDASYRLRKLVRAGLLAVDDMGPNERRVATVVATGARTGRGPL